MSVEPVPAWEQRFRAPTITLPLWPKKAPERFAVNSNETGSWQLYAWDRAACKRRLVTEERVGVIEGGLTADGSGVVWFHEETGDEFGRWMVAPFEGGEPRTLAPEVEDGWATGIAIGDRVLALAMGHRDGFAAYAKVTDATPRVLMRHEEMLALGGAGWASGTGGLSADESLVCVEHSDHGDRLHPALRVLDARTGEVVGDLWDGQGFGLHGAAWSPVPGDPRLAVTHEREGIDRPAVWDLRSGDRLDLSLDLPGEIRVLDWWPDASSLLILQAHEGQDRLHRYEVGSGAVAPVDHDQGVISTARVRPDGRVWYRHSSGTRAARVLDDAGKAVIAPEGPVAPDGRPYESWEFRNPKGQRVHGFLVTPPARAPFPVLMEVHGGPQWLYEDAFAPQVQAFVDAGFAVAMVNYRGSTGYGREWRDTLIGNPGFPEVEDVVAGLDDLVARGIADPERVAIHGESWGGYITLLSIGLHPDRWSAAVAGVPVADYVAAFADEAPALQTMDRGLFGGGPEELPALYRERSPITYVDRVKTPLLILAGENDSRCPIRQIDNYISALEERGAGAETYRYETGHSSFVTEERVRQTRRKLEFLRKHVRLG